jgi:hypothetical protein
MKSSPLFLILTVIASFSSCCKRSDNIKEVESIIVGNDQKNNFIPTAVQWVDGKEIFLSDTTSGTATFALKVLRNNNNIYIFGTKQITPVYPGGPLGQLPLLWENGVEKALLYTYLASSFKDAVIIGNDVYVLTGEMDNNWTPSNPTGHLVLYKNGVVIWDKTLIHAYSNNSLLRISNNRIYIATSEERAGKNVSICFQDGIEIFNTVNTESWTTVGLEVLNDQVTIFANESSNTFYCAAFQLGKGKIKIADGKSIIKSFVQDNSVCAFVRATNNSNKDVFIWKNGFLTDFKVPTTLELPEVYGVTKPYTVMDKEYFVGVLRNNTTYQRSNIIFENQIAKSTLSSVRVANIYDAVFY